MLLPAEPGFKPHVRSCDDARLSRRSRDMGVHGAVLAVRGVAGTKSGLGSAGSLLAVKGEPGVLAGTKIGDFPGEGLTGTRLSGGGPSGVAPVSGASRAT